MQTCKTCKWWKFPKPKNTGTCYRHPPTPVVDPESHILYHVYPTTERDDFCGDHAPTDKASE